jgi:hypothetical protein
MGALSFAVPAFVRYLYFRLSAVGTDGAFWGGAPRPVHNRKPV